MASELRDVPPVYEYIAVLVFLLKRAPGLLILEALDVDVHKPLEPLVILLACQFPLDDSLRVQLANLLVYPVILTVVLIHCLIEYFVL